MKTHGVGAIDKLPASLEGQMRLSILVVSRTPELLSRMLASLNTATQLPYQQVEVLCSWNGAQKEEEEINNRSGYELLIAQRDPYHFASNMNGLASNANGELLLLINDDVTLDAGSIDAAIHCIQHQQRVGLVGARLRDSSGMLTHAGILFDTRHSPYHQLDRQIEANDQIALGDSRPVPAVTGAVMMISRENFAALRFSTDFRVCGEDVKLCLDLRRQLGLEVWYCPSFSGVHEAESTRSQTPEQQNNSEDMVQMRKIHREFLENVEQLQLLQELEASVAEAEALRAIAIQLRQKDAGKNATNWEEQCHSLQLTRLRQKQELEKLRRDTLANQPF